MADKSWHETGDGPISFRLDRIRGVLQANHFLKVAAYLMRSPATLPK